jgi:Family of unknown function (DUF6262)
MEAIGRNAMADGKINLERSWKERKESTREKAALTIHQLQSEGNHVNFSTVHKRSGVSKSFLYDDEEIRKMIEAVRQQEVYKEMNRRARYEKTSQSKDVIIEAKDKRIAKLETEIKKLKAEIEVLRGSL